MSEEFKNMVRQSLVKQADNIIALDRRGELTAKVAAEFAEAVTDAYERSLIDSDDCYLLAQTAVKEGADRKIFLGLANAVGVTYGDHNVYEDEDEECYCDPLAELKTAAFEVLLTHPGYEVSEWQEELVENYGMEVVDAFGTVPEECYASLADLWDDVYYDQASGMEKRYREWADLFVNDETVDLYYKYIELLKRE